MIHTIAQIYGHDWQYANQTTIHPVGAGAVLAMGIWCFFASRKTALLPFLVLICFIPSAQRIVIAGADFTLLRIMVLFGLARIVSRGEFTAIRFNRIDWVFVALSIVSGVVYSLQGMDMTSVVYSCGMAMDMLGAYFVTRALVQNLADFRSFAVTAAMIAMPVAAFFAFELATQRNLFAVFGGVREITWIRDGRLRCQGAFSHAILAGVFWAALGAIFFGGAASPGLRRWVFIAGTGASLLIIVASASSTPVLGFAAAIGFWAWYPIRHWMRWVFLATPFVLFALHLAMEAPVWHLVSRVSAVGGSTGWHRYALIDGAVRHFGEWAVMGTRSTAHWGRGLSDVTNQYILEGVRGGIWRLGLFVALIYLVGRSIATAQGRVTEKADRLLLWGLGASLFVHCVCFIGVSYFGQILYLWYITLAIGASAFAPEFCGSTNRQPAASRPRQVRRFFVSPGKPEPAGA